MAKYIYYNVNPQGERKNDCVTRAISLCCQLPYKTVRKKLFHTAKLLNCDKLCVCCYKHLLDDVFKFQRVNCDGLTVEEFADKYPNGRYLVRMGGHISTVIDNCIYDIFDCRDLWLTDAWKVK